MHVNLGSVFGAFNEDVDDGFFLVLRDDGHVHHGLLTEFWCLDEDDLVVLLRGGLNDVHAWSDWFFGFLGGGEEVEVFGDLRSTTVGCGNRGRELRATAGEAGWEICLEARVEVGESRCGG